MMQLGVGQHFYKSFNLVVNSMFSFIGLKK